MAAPTPAAAALAPAPTAAEVAAQGRAQEAEREARLAEARRKEAESKKKEAEAEYEAYRRRYAEIKTPDDGRYFVDRYSGRYDPDKLVAKAVKRGYENAIYEAKQCLTYWERQLRNQKEIGAVSGVVDKTVMYQAGANIVSCQRRLDQYQASMPN
ncbi:hypothetical protein [uncultured Pseudacidovorax sp.]|uniref:hypothetical protein n=1 Tax=uncultured Pseudacidovorax sp. TaxID=679313 RepID=UPI0025CF8A46|nr:hypothetical protein [uncultured Pseudacidovorax sp.]